jgi:hypothetical protein
LWAEEKKINLIDSPYGLVIVGCYNIGDSSGEIK